STARRTSAAPSTTPQLEWTALRDRPGRSNMAPPPRCLLWLLYAAGAGAPRARLVRGACADGRASGNAGTLHTAGFGAFGNDGACGGGGSGAFGNDGTCRRARPGRGRAVGCAFGEVDVGRGRGAGVAGGTARAGPGARRALGNDGTYHGGGRRAFG